MRFVGLLLCLLITSEQATAQKYHQTKRGRRHPAPAVPTSETLRYRPVNGGIINGRAISLPPPVWNAVALKACIRPHTAEVEVLIDLGGRVVEARVLKAHPLLHAALLKAAKQARFIPAGDFHVYIKGRLRYDIRPPLN